MEPRSLGLTGLRISRLGVGLAALGRPGYINLGRRQDLGADREVADLRTRTHVVLDEAWRLGIRYFDAARSYGLAEAFLAGWLERRQGAEGAVIGSKWGYTYTADWRIEADAHEVKDHSLEVLRRQWRESRSLLGDRLSLYQVHSATRETGVLEDASVLAELARLRDEHGVQIGLTLSGPAQPETLLDALGAEHDGLRVFDVVQATWNLLEPSAGDALRQASEEGLGVIVKEALANGRLTPANDHPEFEQRRLVLDAEATRLATTPDALALAAALARPWADVALSGAVTPEQLRSNIGALDVAWDAEAEAKLAELAEPAAQYWRTRAGLAWS